MSNDQTDSPQDQDMPEITDGNRLIEPDLNWGRAAKPEIEAAINRLLDRFVEAPFRHRCEHSFHCDLIEELQKSTTLATPTIPLEQGFSTQLIHKEWPEPTPRAQNGKRGNIDVSVLTPLPNPLNTVSLKSFRAGIIRPYAGIELGLGRTYRHLVKDYDKLHVSGIEATYVIHFSRRHSADQEKAWEFIVERELSRNDRHEGSPAIAAVFLVGNEFRIKRPDSSQLTVRVIPGRFINFRFGDTNDEDERLLREFQL